MKFLVLVHTKSKCKIGERQLQIDMVKIYYDGTNYTTITPINTNTYTFTVAPSKTVTYSITTLIDTYCSVSSNTFLSGIDNRITVHPYPLANFNYIRASVCLPTAYDANITLTGTPPFTLIYGQTNNRDNSTTFSTTVVASLGSGSTLTETGTTNFTGQKNYSYKLPITIPELSYPTQQNTYVYPISIQDNSCFADGTKSYAYDTWGNTHSPLWYDMDITPLTPATITVQPTTSTNGIGNGYCVGDVVNYSVTITGGLNEVFYWDKTSGANQFSNYTGVTTSTYTNTQVNTFTLAGLTTNSAGDYRVRLIQNNGTCSAITSNTFSLTVNTLPTATIAYPNAAVCSYDGTITPTIT